MFALPPLGLPIPLDGKFLEVLKPFFQKGFKQVRTESATFRDYFCCSLLNASLISSRR